jgi:hypothetical protein
MIGEDLGSFSKWLITITPTGSLSISVPSFLHPYLLPSIAIPLMRYLNSLRTMLISSSVWVVVFVLPSIVSNIALSKGITSCFVNV